MPRASKRVAAEVAAHPVAKAPKRDPNLQGVSEGLSRAVAIGVLDEMTAKMLDLGSVGAFSSAPVDRHEAQTKVILMLEDVLQKVKSHGQSLLDEATSKVTELDASKSDLDNKVEVAEESLKRASEEVEEAAAALASAGQQVKETEAELSAKRATQADVQKALVEATRVQDAFAAGVESHLKPLQDAECGEAGLASHKDAVVPLLEEAGVEESCLLAFPSSCEKPVSARTSFDTMVFQVVAQAVAAKQEANATIVKEQTTSLETATSEVKTCQEAVDASVQNRKVAEEALAQATAKKLAAEEVAAEAQAAKANFEPTCAKAAAAREECAADLENFTVYNMGCFEVLRDGPQEVKAKTIAAVQGGA